MNLPPPGGGAKRQGSRLYLNLTILGRRVNLSLLQSVINRFSPGFAHNNGASV
jgi:hypothetical protein